MLQIFLVEDNPGDARLIRELLRETESLRFELRHADRLADALQVLSAGGTDVVLLDLSLPDAHGMETLKRTLAQAPEAPIIVLTGLDDEELALRAVHAGAQDYLVKGQVDGAGLVRAIRYACERKRLELERAELLHRERQARAQAEAAVRARDEVLRVVAHDLGNSLSAIVVVSTVLLRRGLENVAPEDGQRRVQQIRDLAVQMQRLRQDLLDAASLESGRLSVTLDPREPVGLVADAIEHFAPLAAEAGIELLQRVDAPLPEVLADDARVQQVFANLIGNALKFTASGGCVTVAAEAVDGGVSFRVADTGRGIPAEHLPHIFDSFWTTREGNRTGAGLGLAIAKGIVEAHGGQIHVESVVNEGTSFYFTLPAV
jgi:phosphoserine phosphatase RsbU/P